MRRRSVGIRGALLLLTALVATYPIAFADPSDDDFLLAHTRPAATAEGMTTTVASFTACGGPTQICSAVVITLRYSITIDGETTVHLTSKYGAATGASTTDFVYPSTAILTRISAFQNWCSRPSGVCGTSRATSEEIPLSL